MMLSDVCQSRTSGVTRSRLRDSLSACSVCVFEKFCELDSSKCCRRGFRQHFPSGQPPTHGRDE